MMVVVPLGGRLDQGEGALGGGQIARLQGLTQGRERALPRTSLATQDAAAGNPEEWMSWNDAAALAGGNWRDEPRSEATGLPCIE